MGIDKRPKKSVAKNPLKKMGSSEGERGTRLDPYYREKINVRDIPELIEEDEEEDEEEDNVNRAFERSDLEKGMLEGEDWD